MQNIHVQNTTNEQIQYLWEKQSSVKFKKYMIKLT